MRQYWENEDYKFPPWKKHDGSVFICHAKDEKKEFIITVENVKDVEEIIKERPLLKNTDKIIKICNANNEKIWEAETTHNKKTNIKIDKQWNIRFIKNDDIFEESVLLKDKNAALAFAKAKVGNTYDDVIDIYPEGGRIASWTNRILKQRLRQKLKDFEDDKKGVLKNKNQLEQYIKSRLK